MEGYRNPILVAAFIVAVLSSLPTTAKAITPEVELAGRRVSMELIKSDLSPAPWPTETVTLGTQSIVTKAGDKISTLLSDNGIRPDSEAYTIVYDLNPTLEGITGLAPQTALVLPKVTGGAQLSEALAQGSRVMVTVDGSAKAQLRCNAIAINGLSKAFALLGSNRFPDPAKQQETINSVNELASWFQHMRQTFGRRTARPLRQVTLLQTASEADILVMILERSIGSAQAISPADLAQIAAIHKDVKDTMTRWDQTMDGELPPGEPQYTVIVTIRGNDTARIQRLRVYYVLDGLFSDPLTDPPVKSVNFATLGSGAKAILPIKDYKVWAAKDGDPLHPVTPVTDLHVSKPTSGATIPLDLSLPN